MNTSKMLEYYADITQTALDKYVPQINNIQKLVNEAMRYSLLSGGKRLRPTLLMEFCRVSGGCIEDSLPFACALEMIHTYSLIHDDLPCMDNDDLRRGKPTAHKAYGEAFALLAGDGLLNMAFETMLASKTVKPECALRASYEIAHCSGIHGMIGGQTVDLQNDGKMADLDELQSMISMKTGALIRAAAKAGTILGGATDTQTNAAVEYAENIGLAFQITDDILDIEGDEHLLGKSIGSDKEQGKSTFPQILGIDECKHRVMILTENAKHSVEVFEDNDLLINLADMLASRDH